MIGIMGDTHGHWNELSKIVEGNPEIISWLHVGDLGGVDMSYPDFTVPFYFISGNHENWDQIEEIDKGQGPKNLHHIKNGEYITVDGLNILGFGGNYSPRFSIGQHKLQGDRRRHNTPDQLSQALKAMSIDIFMCHEPPKPYMLRGKDCGVESINKILIAVKPKVCFFGHHHYLTVGTMIESVPCTGLDYGWKSFVRVNPENRKYKVIQVI
jgi:Icc-related predicted phosphoesterase